MSYRSVLNVCNGRPSNPKLTLKINSLRIKLKAQNFASWVLSEHAFKIGRKTGSDFLIIVPHRTTAKRESDLLITSMSTDWIGRHDVLLPINQNYEEIREANKASTERWTMLKRRYECWKTQQFTQQSAPQQRAQNGAYCPIASMTCATVQLMLKSGCW